MGRGFLHLEPFSRCFRIRLESGEVSGWSPFRTQTGRGFANFSAGAPSGLGWNHSFFGGRTLGLGANFSTGLVFSLEAQLGAERPLYSLTLLGVNSESCFSFRVSGLPGGFRFLESGFCGAVSGKRFWGSVSGSGFCDRDSEADVVWGVFRCFWGWPGDSPILSGIPVSSSTHVRLRRRPAGAPVSQSQRRLVCSAR